MRVTYAQMALFGAGSLLLASMVVAQETGGAAEPNRILVLPERYRDWQLISVAHEAGSLNDIRAVLGNRIAVDAYRSGKRPFPDGTVLIRLAYKYVSSAQNNAVFGQAQSFVAGDPTNVQISVKDSRKFSATGGWGYGQFVNGKPDPGSQPVETCFACHHRLDAPRDLVFTNYAP